MKKPLKIFTYTTLSLLLIAILLVIIASLSQNKIANIALKKISESIKAPIEIENVSFTLIKRFPHATIELSGVRIGNENSGKTGLQTLSNEDILKIKKVYISVKTIPLIRGEYEVNIIELNDARVNYKVDSLGNSNIDFLLKSDENVANSDSSGFPLVDLEKVKLKNTLVYYADDSLKMAAKLFFPSLDIKGKMANEKFEGSAEGNLQLTNCSFQNTSLNRMDEANISFKLDYKSDTLKIIKLEALTDGANIEILGKTAFSETIFADLAIELKEVELEKLKKYVPDKLLKEYGIEEFSGNMNLSGSVQGFVSDSILPSIDFQVNLKNGFVKTKDFPAVQKINFDGEISNGSEQNNKTTSASFKSFHAETDSSTVDLNFSLLNFEKPVYNIQSKIKINLVEFKEFIPDSIIQNIAGKVSGELSAKGQMPDFIDNNFINHIANNTSANLDFSNLQIKMDTLHINNLNGLLTYTPKHLIVQNLTTEIPEWQLLLKNTSLDANFLGKLTQLDDLQIILNSFKTETPQGNFWGSAKIKNVEYPEFVADAGAKINLAEIKLFLPDSLIKSIAGNLDVVISTHGKLNLDSIYQQGRDILFKQSSIKLVANNISLSMPDTLQKISGLNGEAEMENGKITISKTSGMAAGIDFSIDSTTISNVYEAVIKNKNQTLRAQGNLEFGAIDYSLLAPFLPSESTKENTNNNSPINFLFELKGKISAKSFKYDKVFLEDISAKFNLTDSVYIVDQFKTRAFEGNTNSSVRYSLTKNNRQIINVKNHVENMDINKLLFAFDNFGYDSLISYENLSGFFSADLNSRFVFDADTLVSNDMRILGNFKLRNGKLVNYEPAMEVSKFTGIKELDNIDMKTLECNIFMFKNKIYVPITKIVSSSLDLSTFGMQSMGDDYEYHIQMKLSEILKGKSQKLIERQNSSGDEISEDDIDNNTIKLIYAYVDGKKKVGFATKKAQKQMALKIQVQQKMLELIFHPKLVSFETDVK